MIDILAKVSKPFVVSKKCWRCRKSILVGLVMLNRRAGKYLLKHNAVPSSKCNNLEDLAVEVHFTG